MLPAIGVQFIVSEVLPQISVEAVRPGLDRSTDDTALEISELGGGIAADQVEFRMASGAGV